MTIMATLKVKAVVFDLSGTLYRNRELDEQYPLRLYKLVAESRKIGLWEAKNVFSEEKKALEKELDEHVTKLSVMQSLGFDRKSVHDAYCTVEPAEYLGRDDRLVETLNTVLVEYALGLITNLRTVQAVKTLRALGVDENVFKAVLGEESVSEVKPSTEAFAKMLGLLGLPARECLYVSDSVTKDLVPAKKTGYLTARVSDKELRQEHRPHVDYEIKEIYEILGLLGLPKPV